MRSPYYTGRPRAGRRPEPVELPPSRGAIRSRPEAYIPDPGLVDAVNVALLLGQPLLLTGEPGTGKTQLAHHLAWELGFDPPLRFETKSTSTAGDLFYSYNALARFHAAQSGERAGRGADYLTYHALGEAIVRAADEAAVADVLPTGFVHGGRRRSVVLIDEVDKAPAELPNDVLVEVEEMAFRIPELGNPLVRADPEIAPVLVLTSNSERHLPDAFLRRCAYYHIPFPDDERLERIVEARLGEGFGRSSSGNGM
jgi:MoxR-like ATPase